MKQRTLGMTSVSVLSVMVGLYANMAGIALLFGGAIGAYEGSYLGNSVFALGLAFMALSFGAYVVAGGVWLTTSWAWAASIVQFVTLIVLNLLLSLMADSYINVLLPAVGAAAAIFYLTRPNTKAAFRGEKTPQRSDAQSRTAGEVAKTLA